MKLSIIIPVYNVEKYLERCLDSCFNQNIPINEYEVIAVNDGSPDNCDKILAVYSNIYSNLKIITQKNGGLSVARNNGFKVARGEYVWFIDSDDWIEKNCLYDIFISLEKKPDILQLQHQLVFEDGHIKKIKLNKYITETPISGKQTIINGGLPTPAQFSIYNRDFLLRHNIEFFPKILHEDSEFKPRVTYFAESILWHNTIVYNYFQRSSGSIMSSFKLKNAMDMIGVNIRLINFCKFNIKERKVRVYFRKFIGLNFNTILHGSLQLNEENRKSIISKLCINKQIFRNMIQSNKIKYQLEGILFLLMPKLAFRIHKLLII